MSNKPNVLSNNLDQAPKTHAAWYWKRVDEMRQDIIEAMNSVNVPNVLSNDSDQAPKIRATWYQQVLDSLDDQIKERMDSLLLHWNDTLCDWMNNNQQDMPLKEILDLKPGEKLSFEVKREEDHVVWISKAVWWPAFMWDFPNFMHNFYSRNWSIQPWQKSLIIVVEKDKDDPKLLKLHAEQLEYPWKNAMSMPWMFFMNRNVDDKRFMEIIWYTNDQWQWATKNNID